MTRQLLDHETKQALLSAVSHRQEVLVATANDLLRQAEVAIAAKQDDLAEKLHAKADEYAARATLLRRLWNDAHPIDVRVVLTREAR